MPLALLRSGGNAPVKAVLFRKAGSWRRVRRALVWADGAWRVFHIGSDPMTVSINPAEIYRALTVGNGSASASASAAGGRAPYSYAWSLSGIDGSISLSSTDGVSTTLTASGVAAGGEATATLTITVTDADGSQATASAYVTFYRADTGGFQ